MAASGFQCKAIASFAVLVALLAGAATLRAAIGAESGASAPQVKASASGAMSITDSKGEGAIFALDNIGPGEGGQGEVTITNSGSAAGSLTLASIEPSNMPGRYGGLLMGRLLLQLEEPDAAGNPLIYSGQLGAMPELQLGTLAAGESRTYRFVVTMLDGGSPSSPYADDNLYQRASASLGYEWTLTEVEGEEGGPEPEPEPEEPSPPSPPMPAPPAPTSEPGSSPPVANPQPPTEDVGTPHADRLIGGSEDDVINGRGGADRIFGRGGGDRLIGGAGRDWLYGDSGDDRLWGGAGSDHLLGGPGADAIHARGGGRDFVDCGAGRDLARVDRHDRVRGCERVTGR